MMLKLKKVFNRRVFEVRYKDEIEFNIKKCIGHFLRQSEYFEESHIFVVNNIVEIFIKDLHNIKFLKIRKRIYELVDDLETRVSFYDISLKESLLDIRLSSEKKDVEEKPDRAEYKTKRQRMKLKLRNEHEERTRLNKEIKHINRIQNLKNKIKNLNLRLLKRKFHINLLTNENYKPISELGNCDNIDPKFLKYLDFFKEIGTVRLDKRKLASMKYIFSIKKRSVVAYHKVKKQYFSINNIIKNRNEIKNLFK